MKEIPVEYQVLIGSAIGGLILFLIRSIRDYIRTPREESQKMAIWAIVLGVIIILPLSAIGLPLAIISFFRKKNKTLSKVAIIINIITMLPWIAMAIWGA